MGEDARKPPEIASMQDMRAHLRFVWVAGDRRAVLLSETKNWLGDGFERRIKAVRKAVRASDGTAAMSGGVV